jgi:translation elongation factor EF-G
VTKKEELRHSSDKEPLAALAFKIMLDEGRKLYLSADLFR